LSNSTGAALIEEKRCAAGEASRRLYLAGIVPESAESGGGHSVFFPDATSQQDINLIKSRLALAKQHAEENGYV